MTEFNFDEWMALAKDSPEEFERKRTELLQAEIMKAPVQIRGDLRVLQMQCDAFHNELSPMGAVVEITKLMLNSQAKLKNKLGELDDAVVEFTDCMLLHYDQSYKNIRLKPPGS